MGWLERYRRRPALDAEQLARQDAERMHRLAASQRLLRATPPVGQLDGLDALLLRRLAAATVWANSPSMDAALAHMLMREPQEIQARLQELYRAGWIHAVEAQEEWENGTWVISAHALVVLGSEQLA